MPRLFSGVWTIFSTNGAGRNLDIHMQKNEAGALFSIIYKSNSKWIKHLNVRAKIIKLLEEHIGENLHDFRLWHRKALLTE